MKNTCFSGTVLKKDITRFAPVWGLYTVFMLLFVFLLWQVESTPARLVRNLPEILMAMGMLNFAYAGICALLLFSDIFKARFCNALHALPLRREGWFFTHVCAGLLFSLAPNLLGATLTGVLLGKYCLGAVLWLSVMSLQYLFFFCVGAFACLCAGNRVGATAVYGIVNFFSVLVTFLAQLLLEPLLYGVKLDITAYNRLSPVVAFSGFSYLDINYSSAKTGATIKTFYPQQWRYLAVAAAVGVVFLAVALLLYRRRKLESAGDFVAVQAVSPVFLTVYTLCAGGILYALAVDLAEGVQYGFLLAGLAIGFFTGKMLLQRRVNVFRFKSFLGFGTLLALLGLIMGLTWLDPIGITRQIPQPQQIRQVELNTNQYIMATRYKRTFTQPADIEGILQLHEALLEDRSGGDVYLWIDYTMQDGTKLTRQYTLKPVSKAGQLLKTYYADVESVLGTDNIEKLLMYTTLLECYRYSDNVGNIMISAADGPEISELEQDNKFGNAALIYKEPGTLDESQIAMGLLEAIKKDCEAGNMVQLRQYHEKEDLYASVVLNRSGKTVSLDIYASCVNTINYLSQLTEK